MKKRKKRAIKAQLSADELAWFVSKGGDEASRSFAWPPLLRTLNQASVSVYYEKMLGGKWHVFEFHQV